MPQSMRSRTTYGLSSDDTARLGLIEREVTLELMGMCWTRNGFGRMRRVAGASYVRQVSHAEDLEDGE
jgi:hypothetical protein